MDIIKSKDNNKIKFVRLLKSKKNRDEENAFVVEGIKFVKEAIKENADILYLLYTKSALERNEIKEIYDLSSNQNIENVVCEDIIFGGVADTINAQGILAVVKKSPNSKEIQDFKFVIMCDRIQDPGNLGTIIRTADAFGPAIIVLNKGCVDIYNPKVVRASAGAIFRVDYLLYDSDEEMIDTLKKSGFKIISTVVDSDYSFDDICVSNKICVVIGNEGQGVSREIVNNSHISITIKMSGRSESLNASIAAGISIYEIRKKLL